MNLAFINDTFMKGRGADVVIYELARRLGKKHEVYVLASQTDIKEENFKFIKLTTKKFLTGGIKDFAFLFNLKKLKDNVVEIIKEKNIEVINFHHAAMSIIFKDLRKEFPNLKVFATFHGFPPASISEKNPLRTIGRKFIRNFGIKNLKYCDKVIAISEYMKKDLIKKGLKEEKIITIYDGVSSEFYPTGKDKGYMLFVGRHEPHKSINETILISKSLKYPLRIAGFGPLTDSLFNFKEEIKADKVTFLGGISRKELIKEYQNCSFFISASKWEGFGLIFLEAGLCGKPSVAYNTCAIPEVIKNKSTGLLVNDFKNLKNCASKLIKDKRLRIRYGKNAIRYAKNFLWEKSVDKYEELFKNG